MKSNINYFGLLFFAIQFVILQMVFSGYLSNLWIVLLALPLFFMLFQISVKQKKWSKKILLSPLNFLSCKSSKRLEIDIEPNLLFDKLMSEISDSGSKIEYAIKEEKTILVCSPISIRTWGDNIYFDILENEGHSELLIRSVSAQIVSWGKNDENISKLVKHIEDSFVI